MDNKLDPNVRPHTTHFACDERLAKYGGKTVGCCCTGHVCQVDHKAEVAQPRNTGHKNRRMPDGSTVVEWARPVVQDEARFYGVDMPSDEQIAIVIRALRMHHLMTHAAGYDQSELHSPNEVTTFWPIESSIGRFLRDAPLELLDQINLGQRHGSTNN
jgi:hypothetical protein